MNLKKLEGYLRVNMLGPGPHLIKKKRIYRAAVSQRLRNTGIEGNRDGRQYQHILQNVTVPSVRMRYPDGN